jgi:hypothetical protein
VFSGTRLTLRVSQPARFHPRPPAFARWLLASFGWAGQAKAVSPKPRSGEGGLFPPFEFLRTGSRLEFRELRTRHLYEHAGEHFALARSRSTLRRVVCASWQRLSKTKPWIRPRQPANPFVTEMDWATSTHRPAPRPDAPMPNH